MTTETSAAEIETTTAPEITDEQLDHFFETEGELPDSVSGENGETAEKDANTAQNTDETDGKQAASTENQQHAEKPLTPEEISNYKAMAKEERIRRQEIESQLNQFKTDNQKLNETLQKIIQRAQEREEQQLKESAPNFDDDPIGALKQQSEMTQKQIADLKAERAEEARTRDEQIRIKAEREKFVGTYRQQADEFAKQTPEFNDAYKYLMEQRLAEFEAAGYNKEEAHQALMDDEAAIVQQAFKQQVNPAERIYKIATLRGFKSKDKINAAPVNPNQAKIDLLEKGLKASRTVNTGGTGAPEKLTLESIAEMSDAEFDKFDWEEILKLG